LSGRARPSIYSKGARRVDKSIFGLGIPILGICYGLQIHGGFSGRKSDRFDLSREYVGFAELLVKKQKVLALTA